MTNLLIDTCVWLDLAKSIKDERLLTIIEQLVDDWEIRLILPEIVLSEFQKNKLRIVQDASKNLNSHFHKVRDIIYDHGTDKEKNVILSHLREFHDRIPILGEAAFLSLQKIERLFEQAEIIRITDEIKLKAAQRALDKKAPFHLSKNSMGDAIIIESFIQYVAQNNTGDSNFMFITHNKNDFSLKSGNYNLPHEDIKEHFNFRTSYYFISLSEAITKINPDIIGNEYHSEWYDEPRNVTDIKNAATEIEEMIWFTRHKNLECKIKAGEIQIIEMSDYKVENAHKTIVDRIWQGAQKNAVMIEDRYGAENLLFDDFNLGLLNGKLSALRWVLGEEWDFLDT